MHVYCSRHLDLLADSYIALYDIYVELYKHLLLKC